MSSVAVSGSPDSTSNSNIVTCSYRHLNVDVDSSVHINPKIFKLMNFCLSGMGEKGANCGGFHVSHVCENGQCGKAHYLKNRCYRKECPDCYGAWKMRAVNAIEARLYSQKARETNGVRRLAHIVLTMKKSEEIKTKKDFDKMIQAGYKYAEKNGVKGGVMIIHAFRATSEAKYLAHQAGKRTWEWIRAQAHHERYMRYSPHFHIVGYFDYLKKQKKGEKWLYKSITDVDGSIINYSISLSGEEKKDKVLEGLRKTVNYLLSHTVALKDARFESIRWFGNCSKRAFGPTEEEKAAAVVPEMEPQYCKVCGAPLVMFRRWVRENYYRVMQGDVPEPKYFREIEDIMEGEGPPENAKDFVVGDVKEKIKSGEDPLYVLGSVNL